jgi:hypothetical protein
MKTATMTTPPLAPYTITSGVAKASGSAIDAYASHVLQSMSPPDALIDTSVGPYVTALLRCAGIHDKNQLTKLVEYESLLELLEDQCNMDHKTATGALEIIADAVTTQLLPLDQIGSWSDVSSALTSKVNFGQYSGGELDLFQSLRSSLPGCDAAVVPQNSSLSKGVLSVQTGESTTILETCTPSSVGGPSPLRPDNLIPFDLLGVLDHPSPYQQGQESQSTPEDFSVQCFSPPNQALHHQHNCPSGSRVSEAARPQQQQEDFPPLRKSVDSFPPLGASSTEKPKKSKTGSSRKSVSGKTHQHSDKDLAAALFRPARARQNSIENEDASGSAPSTTRLRGQSFGGGPYEDTGYQTNLYFQQQMSSCIEILLSMNHDLSEEAATQASLMANTDFNVAHYLVDAAMTAPPICRHLLHEGCYRSDCQFSHDVEGHTCLFWIRGRCGKGSACRFLHGFNEKLLNDIRSADNVASSVPSANRQQLVQDHNQLTNEDAIAINGSNDADASAPPGYPGYAYTVSSSSSIVDDYSSFSPGLTSSWQPPSVADTSSTSNSYSSSDFSFSFANVASKGYEKAKFLKPATPPSYHLNQNSVSHANTVRIPQDLWNPHENRDPSVFFISDPLERYYKVATTVRRADVIDLHFQSTKTFGVVLSSILPHKLYEMDEVWIVTGTGHHVGRKTHQKAGGALEGAVIQWLSDEGYNFSCGKDRNGLGGALLVRR